MSNVGKPIEIVNIPEPVEITPEPVKEPMPVKEPVKVPA